MKSRRSQRRVGSSFRNARSSGKPGRRILAKVRRAWFEGLEPRQMLTATNFSAALLKDINTSPASSSPTTFGQNSFATIGNEAYFAAHDQSHGTELYKSDGSTASLVKDIVPGTESSDPTNLTNVGGTLYFTVTSPSQTGSGTESLWSSDGTAAGTKLLGVLPGATRVFDLTAVGNKLFFHHGRLFGLAALGQRRRRAKGVAAIRPERACVVAGGFQRRSVFCL